MDFFKASLSIRSSSFHKCPYLVFMTTIHGQVKVRISNMIQIQHTRELFAIFYIFLNITVSILLTFSQVARNGMLQ